MSFTERLISASLESKVLSSGAMIISKLSILTIPLELEEIQRVDSKTSIKFSFHYRVIGIQTFDISNFLSYSNSNKYVKYIYKKHHLTFNCKKKF